MIDKDTLDFRTRELYEARSLPGETDKVHQAKITGPFGESKWLRITPAEYARVVEALTTDPHITYRVQPHDITTLTWPMWDACGIECPKMIGAPCPADRAHFEGTCPGWSSKWDNAATEVVCGWTMASAQDDTCGDVDQPIGWNGLFRTDPGEAQDGPMGAGLILTTGSQGDVHLARYAKLSELMEEWNALQDREAEYFRANCGDCTDGEPCADHEED